MKQVLKSVLMANGLLILMCLSSRAQIDEEHKAIQSWPKVDYNELSRHFKSPDNLYGTNCWWWWLNGNVSKDAITKELEAMQTRHFVGAMIFDAGGYDQRGNGKIPAGPQFGSRAWNELFVFALDEARRLGLQIGFNIMSGWNLGGPCVTPEYAAKRLVYSEMRVGGGKHLSTLLKQPQTNQGFYQDIAVLAFPLLPQNVTEKCITFLNEKLALQEIGGSAPDCRFLLNNDAPDKRIGGKTTYVVAAKTVINLTDKMDNTGQLSCSLPKGEWCIMRVGYTCTNASVSTSSETWQGLVVDYLSRRAFDHYWDSVVEPILKAAGSHVGTTLKYMETDSWECGGMNWTDNFARDFKNFCGYDILNFLPVIGGYVVDDISTSNAFLADFRKVIAHDIATNHYARFAERAHQHQMGILPESAGPHAGPLDGIGNYGYSDIAMSEFWSPSPHRPSPPDRFFVKQAASAAHIYGKRIVGAESFTTIGPQWNDELWHNQKSAFDHEVCSGLNRVYFHTFTSSPSSMGLPGQEYFAGTHINPRVTWWNESGAFMDYLRRTQFVMQNGRFVADVLYYEGDHIPNISPYKKADPAGVLPGFDYDVTDENCLLALKVDNGKLVSPGGIQYRVLVLPNHQTLSLAALKKVDTLLQQGVQVVGLKPLHLVSLMGGRKAQSAFCRLADAIWGRDVSAKGERKYGKGVVAWGISARDFLMSKGLVPDFKVEGNPAADAFDYIHVEVDGKQFYFVCNQTEETQKIACSFRVSGLQPELWDALNGETRDAKAFSQHDGVTTLPLCFDPYGSVIICFNRPISETAQGETNRNYPDFKQLKMLDGAWTVHFDPQWGGPEMVEFPCLSDWTKNANEGIKYYSGAATYQQTFNVSFPVQKGKSYFLQLGKVKDVGIARVKINGIDKGTVWTAPFRVDISQELIYGRNTVEIKVINSWFNRIAGDELNPDKKRFTSTNIVLKNKFSNGSPQTIPLQSSGLLGPVTIVEGE